MNWNAHPWKAIRQALNASVAVVCHTFLAMVAVSAVKALELFIHFSFEDTGGLLFDHFPLRYIFDAMEGGVIVVFAFYGIATAIEVFREKN